MPFLSRRSISALIGGAATAVAAGLVQVRALGAKPLPHVTVHKDPSCGCCTAWARHLEQDGFSVTLVQQDDMMRVKARLGVPDDLQSCHTAEIGGYVVEGHVPAISVRRLLAEAPQATGLAVAGMPGGSPGMEGGEPEEYEVVLFGPTGRRTFARYRGTTAI